MRKFELSIPQPCHENWDKMTPEARGRFCAACSKTVMDFTNMSDRQLAQFFKQPSGSVCGRFESGQLNRVLELPPKRIPWIKYFFTIGLPAFLFSAKAIAQGKVMVRDSSVVIPNQKILAPTSGPGNEIKKKITMGKVSRAQTSFFKVEKIDLDSSLFARAPCLLVPSEIKNIKRENAESQALIGIVGMVVKSKPVIRKEIRSESRLEIKTRGVHPSFSIFPNPLKANAVFTIEVKNLPEGRYRLAIVSGAGSTIKTEELVIEQTLKKYPVMLNAIAAGPYFIQLTNLHSATNYTEIIIVE